MIILLLSAKNPENQSIVRRRIPDGRVDPQEAGSDSSFMYFSIYLIKDSHKAHHDLSVIKIGGWAGILTHSWEESKSKDTRNLALSWGDRVPTIFVPQLEDGQPWSTTAPSLPSPPPPAFSPEEESVGTKTCCFFVPFYLHHLLMLQFHFLKTKRRFPSWTTFKYLD